ncbi:septal ring lytic transglycosylase RlpA family protein [Hoeflea prorocentri]|uniref:Endolytic peptidoglycan transglycosylase RlpA n=1 Tax=Hoeflea prorocentri TaxID=1922333 RepID=A0A9X3UGB5_9HYPH|nr:septal ring lytic transglycosylase RlpA family protein [Hoeflea prorocentri]MCY6380762.1 septal ring lytic transglycosylase RlpA family protein [Hoeflea prorocentri]MDA5398562.1 septal ring lytic transglycosylase RlpA family protein [Hoeflea prorocentri]
MQNGFVKTRCGQTSGCAHGGISKKLFHIGILIAGGIALSACGGSPENRADINTKTKFKSKDYGVSASKRVTVSKNVPKGGGTYKIGKPYKVKGRWFHPKEEKDYDKRGYASWYGPNFHGRLTANGEVYDQYHLSAAHPTFPLPSYARVTNLKNGHSVVVRVNDRGPFAKGRIIDVSSKTADVLDMKQEGVAKVRVQYIGKARMDGQDMRYLTASFMKDGRRTPIDTEDTGRSGVMLALNKPRQSIASVFGSNEVEVAAAAPAAGFALAAPSNSISAKSGRLPGTIEVALPAVGPVPRERPPYVPALASGTGGSKTLSSYAQQRIEQQADTPFRVLLSGSNNLTGEMITASWKRRNL